MLSHEVYLSAPGRHLSLAFHSSSEQKVGATVVQGDWWEYFVLEGKKILPTRLELVTCTLLVCHSAD